MQQQRFTEADLDANGPMFSPGTVRYWYQDGGDFYLFDSEASAQGALDHDDAEIAQCTYPHKVIGSWDLQAAITARVWFLTEWCKANNVTPIQVI